METALILVGLFLLLKMRGGTGAGAIAGGSGSSSSSGSGSGSGSTPGGSPGAAPVTDPTAVPPGQTAPVYTNPPVSRPGWTPITYQEIFGVYAPHNPDGSNPTWLAAFGVDLDNEQIDVSSGCGSNQQVAGDPTDTVALEAAQGGLLSISVASKVGAIGGATGGTLGFAAAGSVAATAIPIVGAIVAIGTSIFGAIIKHHSAAVANEKNLVCTLVPAANEALYGIENAVMSQTITPDQGIALLNQLRSDFHTAAYCSSSGCADASSCNAMCEYDLILGGIIAKKSDRYQSYDPSPNTLSISEGLTQPTPVQAAAGFEQATQADSLATGVGGIIGPVITADSTDAEMTAAIENGWLPYEDPRSPFYNDAAANPVPVDPLNA